MGQITLNEEDALRVLNDADAGSEARTIAACTIAFMAADNADEFDASTRSVVLKLAHMIAARIYGCHVP